MEAYMIMALKKRVDEVHREKICNNCGGRDWKNARTWKRKTPVMKGSKAAIEKKKKSLEMEKARK